MKTVGKKVIVRIVIGLIAVIGLVYIAKEELNDPYIQQVIEKLKANDEPRVSPETAHEETAQPAAESNQVSGQRKIRR